MSFNPLSYDDLKRMWEAEFKEWVNEKGARSSARPGEHYDKNSLWNKDWEKYCFENKV